ncbi:MAG: hypothetical protein WCY10_06300, partial [Candidatus Omnitrophota bacterium]
KKQLYFDLAKQFHFRKVKSLRICSGVTLPELSSILELACLPVKEVITRGGVQFLLSEAGVANVQVEELDYSSLLREEGGVEADMGAYLLNQSMRAEDPEKIKEFALHFESAIAHVSVKDIAEDKQLGDNLRNFLAYLHTSDEAAFHRCVQSLFRVVLKDKAPATREQMSAFAGFVKDLSADTIAGIIVDEAAHNDEFNNKNLLMFLQELGASDHNAVSSSLAGTITSEKAKISLSSKSSRKLKDLFKVSDSFVSGIYERVMETLSRNSPAESPFMCDRERVQLNYHFILLFMLGTEQEPQRLDSIAQKICSGWQDVIREPLPDYFHALAAALASSRGQIASVSSLAQLDLLFRCFVEEAAFQEEVPGWIDQLIDDLKESAKDEHWYFEKMFSGGALTRRSLSLFLRLFPEYTDQFCGHLARSAGDIEFMGAVVEELKQVNSPQVTAILESIYGVSNDLIKIEVLKAMTGLPELDEGFLFAIISQENALLRKEAVTVLAPYGPARDKALRLLLSDDDIWGRKNAWVKENIGIVEELAIPGAAPLLERLGRKPFFWNAAVRRRARKSLEALA